jgi:predicted nucleic acid-binding protein
MRLILDSSVLIKAERQGQNAQQLLTAISAQREIATSPSPWVTLIELAQRRGTCRHSAAKGERHQFIHELLTVSSRRCHDIRDDQWNEEHGSPTLSALNRYVRTLHEKRMRTSSVVANNYGGH